jgi:hypothetical protein
MSDVHQYYLVSGDQLEKIEKNPPFLSYSDAYDAIVKTKEEFDTEEKEQKPHKKIANWSTFHWTKK